MGAAVSLAAACTADRPPSPRPVDPDVALVAAAQRREQALLAAYDAALLRAPGLGDLVGSLRDDHAAHLAALRSPAGSPSPAVLPPRPSGQPARPAGASVLAGERAALAALERSTAAEHARAVATASPDLAQLLASLAACESSHVVLL